MDFPQSELLLIHETVQSNWGLLPCIWWWQCWGLGKYLGLRPLMIVLNIRTYTTGSISLQKYDQFQPCFPMKSSTIFSYCVVSADLNKLNFSVWVQNPNNFINCWTGTDSNYSVTNVTRLEFLQELRTARSFCIESQQISKHSFFSRNTHKKLVSRSHGCIFETPKTISVHTEVCYSCQNCSSNQGTEMLLLLVVHLPKCSRIPQRKFRIVGTTMTVKIFEKCMIKILTLH